MSIQRMQRRVSAGSEESCRNSCRTIHKMLCGGVMYASLVPDTAPIAMAGHSCSVRWRNIARKWRSIVKSLAADWWKRNPPVKSICTSSSSRSGGTSGLSVMATHCVSRFDRRRVEAMRSSNPNSIVRSARWEYEKGERKLPLFLCLLNLLHFLPRAALHTEVAVRRRLPIDGAAQVEPLDNRAGTEVEVLVYNLGEIFAVAVVGFYHHRFRAAYCICDRDEHLFPVAIRDEVLGGEAAHVSGGAVDFCRILAGECAAAVRDEAAVRIHLNFPSRQTRVGLEAALHEFARGVHQYFDVIDCSEHRLEQVFNERGAYFFLRDFFCVLCRAQRRDDAFAIADCYLRLPIGPYPRECPAPTQLLKIAGELVREHDAKRKEFRRLIGRVAVHDALITRAFSIDPHGDIGGLLGDRDEHFQIVLIADVRIHSTADFFVIDFPACRHFTAYHERAVAAKRLDGHTRLRVLHKNGIKYRVRYLVAHFVGVTGCNALDIGRAACRERVEISVVAGSFKKRKRAV